jgi:hypothetical protein
MRGTLNVWLEEWSWVDLPIWVPLWDTNYLVVGVIKDKSHMTGMDLGYLDCKTSLKQ